MIGIFPVLIYILYSITGETADIPVIIANETVVNAQIWSNAEMVVTIVTAVPPLKAVIWSRNGKTIFGSRYIGGNIKTPSISINNITASDDGTYRCFVYNEVGSTYVDIFLFTWSKPFIRMSGNNVAGIGSTVNLEGLIISKPNIRNIIWKREYQNTSVVIDFTDSSKFGRSGTIFHPILTITNLQKTMKDFVPLVNSEETDYQGTVGNDIKLNCSYDSNPQAILLYWLKNGTRINLDFQREKYSKTNISYPDLTIFNVQLNDTGIYVCCVGNVIGVGCSVYIKIVIKVEGKCNETSDSDHVYRTLSIYNATYDYSETTDARKSSHFYEDIDTLNEDV
ncbi:unnamed protein product [Mytilus coruscus]|uniref:Ig-like domain-containing protein n=1 Tax=Mytilus coruscus TaxID=42192 RepID=A0A6J8B4S9_MYTCO|nr:unnamed protein product [Mytilus coruscus]